MLSFEGDEENLSIKRFEKMLKTNATYFFDSIDFERIISYYLDQGKIDLAEKAVALALEQHPNSLTLQLFKAEILILKDKTNEALSILNTLSKIEQNNEDIHILTASIYSKNGKHQKAITTLKKILAYTEDHFESNNLIAMEYLFLNKFEEALSYFKISLANNPKDANTLYNVVYCYEMLEKETDLIAFLNDYIDSNPYNELAWHLLGKQYFEQKEYKKALRAFDYAILIDEQFIGALIEKAKTYEQIGDYSNAAANYHITLKLDDPTAFVYLRLGVCYQELKQKEEAIAYFNKAILEDPQLIKAWVAIITFYMEENEHKKALYYAKKAINANDTSDLLWKLIAMINFENQLYEESELAYDNCLELGNYSKSTYLNFIDVLLILGKKVKAIKILVQAKEFYDDALFLYLLAALNYEINDQSADLYFMAALNQDSSIYNEVVKQFKQLKSKKALAIYKSYFKKK